jgi:hypothetical protein
MALLRPVCGTQDKDAEIARLHAELREARAELEDLRRQHTAPHNLNRVVAHLPDILTTS